MPKSVLVTGANSGIGLVTVLELAAAGYDVVGSVRSEDTAEVVHRAAAERGVAVRVALAAPVPLARCVVGAEAVGGILADTLAPTVVGEDVKAVSSGLRTLPIKLASVG